MLLPLPKLHSLKWYQVVNVHGGTGRHIPVDLHIEHLHQMLKDPDADIGENLSDSAQISERRYGDLARTPTYF